MESDPEFIPDCNDDNDDVFLPFSEVAVFLFRIQLH